MFRASRLVAGGVLAASTLASLVGSALAQSSERSSVTTTTSSTATSTTTPTSSTSSSTSSTSSSTTSSTESTSSTSPTSTTSSTTTTAPEPVPELDPDVTGIVPPEIQAEIDAYPRTAARSSQHLVDALEPLPPRLARAAFGRFPVAGLARWSHDWLFPRWVPSFHTHEGTDVFAERGTPVLAPTAGRARISRGSVGGLGVRVVQPDGTYWYLAHLERATVEDGEQVVAGQMVGHVGASGNARGGHPHVHIEVHPHGGEPLDPKRLLDDYYAAALAQAPAIVAEFEARSRLVADRLDPLPA